MRAVNINMLQFSSRICIISIFSLCAKSQSNEYFKIVLFNNQVFKRCRVVVLLRFIYLLGALGKDFLRQMKLRMDSDVLVKIGKDNPFCMPRFYRAFT